MHIFNSSFSIGLTLWAERNKIPAQQQALLWLKLYHNFNHTGMTIESEKKDHPFNNPDQIEIALSEFKNINWEGKIFQDVINEYFIQFASLPLYKTTLKKNTIIFRGRPNEPDKFFSTLNEISIKPSELVTSYGRANIPKQAVFYCSTNEETVIREVTQWYINDNGRFQDLITKGVLNMHWNSATSMMTISAWRVKEDLNLALLFGNEDRRSLEVQEINKHRLEIGKTSNYEHSRNLILDFFSSEFSKKEVRHESDYLYSAYYAYQIYTNYVDPPDTNTPKVKFDGVQYASVANNVRGENIAISEESFRNKIEFLGANFCYTLNTLNSSMKESNSNSAILGIFKSALLRDDLSLEWIESPDDCDYIVRTNGEYYPFKLQREPGFKFPVKRISAG